MPHCRQIFLSLKSWVYRSTTIKSTSWLDHEFVDIVGWQWSLLAKVLHIGATKNKGRFVVYVGFEDTWWLCDDGGVTGDCPPESPRKITVLLYKCK